MFDQNCVSSANRARRMAKEAKDAPVQPAPEKARVDVKKFVKIGRPGYRGEWKWMLWLLGTRFAWEAAMDTNMVAMGTIVYWWSNGCHGHNSVLVKWCLPWTQKCIGEVMVAMDTILYSGMVTAMDIISTCMKWSNVCCQCTPQSMLCRRCVVICPCLVYLDCSDKAEGSWHRTAEPLLSGALSGQWVCVLCIRTYVHDWASVWAMGVYVYAYVGMCVCMWVYRKVCAYTCMCARLHVSVCAFCATP